MTIGIKLKTNRNQTFRNTYSPTHIYSAVLLIFNLVEMKDHTGIWRYFVIFFSKTTKLLIFQNLKLHWNCQADLHLNKQVHLLANYVSTIGIALLSFEVERWLNKPLKGAQVIVEGTGSLAKMHVGQCRKNQRLDAQATIFWILNGNISK